VVAAVYSLFVSTVIYRELKLKQLVPLFVSAATTCAIVMFLVAAAMVSAWLITVANLPAQDNWWNCCSRCWTARSLLMLASS
jgi:TRAP-type C4-dicarboxylate transport system permease large subunit